MKQGQWTGVESSNWDRRTVLRLAIASCMLRSTISALEPCMRDCIVSSYWGTAKRCHSATVPISQPIAATVKLIAEQRRNPSPVTSMVAVSSAIRCCLATGQCVLFIDTDINVANSALSFGRIEFLLGFYGLRRYGFWPKWVLSMISRRLQGLAKFTVKYSPK